MEWLILLVMLGAGIGLAVLVRRRGASWFMTWLATLAGEAVIAALTFVYLLVAHDYPAMPNTPGAILAYALPRLLLLSLLTVAPVLALVRPIAEDARQ